MNKITNRLSLLPMAADQWLMVIVILAAFDKHIPWYVWVLLSAELLGALYIGMKEKLEARKNASAT